MNGLDLCDKLCKKITGSLSSLILLSGNISDLYPSVELADEPLLGIIGRGLRQHGFHVLACDPGSGISGLTPQLQERLKLLHNDSFGALSADSTMPLSGSNLSELISFLHGLCCLPAEDLGLTQASNFSIVINSADLLFPQSSDCAFSSKERNCIAVALQWFSDPIFLNGSIKVILIAESLSLLNFRIGGLAQIQEITLKFPDTQQRLCCIERFISEQSEAVPEILKAKKQDLVAATCGLTIHALRFLLESICREPDMRSCISGVLDSFVRYQLGAQITRYVLPGHDLADVIGFRSLKKFLLDDFIPRCRLEGEASALGAIICGPIGSGKNYIFEAVAAQLGAGVLVIRNLPRSTTTPDLTLERLHRFLEVQDRLFVFIEDAEMQFMEEFPEQNSRINATINGFQRLVENNELRGRIFWLLLTSRVDLLSPDLRRQARVGDLIIPIIDPKAEDLHAFVSSVSEAGLQRKPDKLEIEELRPHFHGLSSSALMALRSELLTQSNLRGRSLAIAEIIDIVADRLESDIGNFRYYQELQALLNCTRKSLLPTPLRAAEQIDNWRDELLRLEEKGYR